MPRRLDVTKAIQAVGVLLRREGKRASRLRLLKLLYIADRISLAETGCQILGSKIVALKHGPLHSEVLDLINGEHIHSPQWSRYFQSVGRDLMLTEEPDVGSLSRYEVELLNRVVDGHDNCSDWDVADETHGFAEWQTIYPDRNENTSRPIPIELLIDSTGRGADKAAILQDMKDSEAFDSVFARLCCQ
ncbi:MAG: SocA family protein [Pirellulales bacterium]|nr:SocA family protein [Pirellulales bacterium]